MRPQHSPCRKSRVYAAWSVPLVAVSLTAASLAGAYSPAASAEPAAAAPAEPAAAGTAAGNSAATCVNSVYGAMTSAQRVGQLFMGGINAATPDQKRIAVLHQYHVGSVFLAGRSTKGTQATKTVVNGLQAKADTVAGHRVGLLISTDQEGGRVQVLSGPGFSTMPSALVQGTWTTTKLRDSAAVWAKQLKAAGVNLNLAPVADVVPASLGKNNAPIGAYDREFGHTAATVTPHSDAFAAGFAQSGVLATVKHFPGLGNVRGNTDTTAGVVDSVTTPKSSSLTPFSSAIKAGIPFVMISSATYTKIDAKHQAVFSSTVIQGLLRKTFNFQGVVVSDDIGNAVAVKKVSPGDRAVRFLSAGGNQVLTVEPNLIPAMVKAVQARMAQSSAFSKQVDTSVHRVLAAKQKAGLLHCG